MLLIVGEIYIELQMAFYYIIVFYNVNILNKKESMRNTDKPSLFTEVPGDRAVKTIIIVIIIIIGKQFLL